MDIFKYLPAKIAFIKSNFCEISHSSFNIYLQNKKYHNTKQIIHSEAECLIEIVHILCNTKVLPGV